jgi:hypothetical protein
MKDRIMKNHQPLKFINPSSLTLLLAVAALSGTLPADAQTQAPAVDPAATQILKRMTDCVGGLKQFSVNTQTTFEDLLDSGHRVDLDVSARAIVSRPNKIRAERRGKRLDQIFQYDGTSLTLFNPPDNVYATVPAPATIEGTLHFVRDSLGLNIPIADLLYNNTFTLLMQDVNLAMVVGKSVINGIQCDQLLFSRPGVDFQVWVADSDKPLPLKYVVTDTGIPARLSTTTVLSDWNVAPGAADAKFTFVPPQGATPIAFLPLVTSNGTNRQP